jgi:hypothetical protein
LNKLEAALAARAWHDARPEALPKEEREKRVNFTHLARAALKKVRRREGRYRGTDQLHPPVESTWIFLAHPPQ